MSRPKRLRGALEEHENHERWLITYADMITLLVAFFIMMYSMSMLDLKKFADLATAMGHVFGGGGSGRALGQTTAEGRGLLPGEPELVPPATDWGGPAGTALVRKIHDQTLATLPPDLRQTIQITRAGGRITISMQASSITFPPGQATLTSQAKRILVHLAPVLRTVEAPILIEGHTCDLPVNTPQFPSNWELSAGRATAVMLFLVRQCHLAPQRLSAAGYADTRPRVPNTSEGNRRRNRRVDLVILPAATIREPAVSAASDLPCPPTAGKKELLAPFPVMPPLALAAEYYSGAGAGGTGADTRAPQSHQEELP